MPKTEDVSKKEQINFIKSWKIENTKTLLVTHENGVDSYDLDNISEIEMETLYKREPDSDDTESFLSFGLILVIATTLGLASLGTFYPDKNYFEKVWLLFPFSILCFYLALYYCSTSFSTFLISWRNLVFGRKLILYDINTGKREYKIYSFHYDEVMTDDFLKVIFSKSTVLNNLLNDYKNINKVSFSDAYNETKSRKRYEDRETKELIRLVFFSIFGMATFSVWFIINPGRSDLVSLIVANTLLLLFLLIQKIKRDKKEKERKKNFEEFKRFKIPNYYIKIYPSHHKDIAHFKLKKDLLFSGSMKQVEIEWTNYSLTLTFTTPSTEETPTKSYNINIPDNYLDEFDYRDKNYIYYNLPPVICHILKLQKEKEYELLIFDYDPS